jgi:alkanesulfonate monooxygenase SsuD/methylene tetrahydromethanopterin reductase-like flavin-dependent oxidoreductase (luciferase family)
MRLGAIMLQTEPWTRLADEVRAVEETGYDVLYVADHLTHPTMAGAWVADPWVTLAAAAAETSTVDLGTLVASSAFRTPVVLARAAASVQDVSGGRLVLGLGAGTAFCATADRGESPSPGDMARRFADMVDGLEAVWAGETAWSGRELAFAGNDTAPSPPGQRRPFLLLAAHGPRAVDLVGQHADGWSTYGGPASVALPEDEYWRLLGEQSRSVDEACRRHGRDAGALRRSLLLGYGTVRPLADAATYRRCIDRAEEAGFDELVVYWPWGEPGGRFHSEREVHVAVVGTERP